jgi:hypothetical protein
LIALTRMLNGAAASASTLLALISAALVTPAVTE